MPTRCNIKLRLGKTERETERKKRTTSGRHSTYHMPLSKYLLHKIIHRIGARWETEIKYVLLYEYIYIYNVPLRVTKFFLSSRSVYTLLLESSKVNSF